MFSKTVFVFAVLMLVMVGASPLQMKSSSSELSIIQLEEPCVRQGGLCLRIEDCDPTNLVKFSKLCPMQQHLGVECCYVNPVSTII